MYGINHNWTSLPPMPIDGDTWSVMHSWVLPTRSFLEFVMFSRCENLHRCFDILLKQTLTIHLLGDFLVLMWPQLQNVRRCIGYTIL